jgi:hypothetical protein
MTMGSRPQSSLTLGAGPRTAAVRTLWRQSDVTSLQSRQPRALTVPRELYWIPIAFLYRTARAVNDPLNTLRRASGHIGPRKRL